MAVRLGMPAARHIAAVNIALGNADYATCTNADADHSGEVLINDLIAAVNAALSGCPE